MEQAFVNESEPLVINQFAREQLLAGAKWAKFLSIMGFIFCGLITVFAFFAGSIFSSMNKLSTYSNPEHVYNPISGVFGFFMAFIYLAMAILYFFPTLYLFRYADKLKIALQHDDQLNMESAFHNLTRMFRFVGVLTIVVFSFYLLLILVVALVALAR